MTQRVRSLYTEVASQAATGQEEGISGMGKFKQNHQGKKRAFRNKQGKLAWRGRSR